LSASYGLGLPSLDNLAELREQLADRDVELWFARLRAHRAGEPPPAQLAGTTRLYPDPDTAVRAYRAEHANGDR
jgi:hypothetical protein